MIYHDSTPFDTIIYPFWKLAKFIDWARKWPVGGNKFGSNYKKGKQSS